MSTAYYYSNCAFPTYKSADLLDPADYGLVDAFASAYYSVVLRFLTFLSSYSYLLIAAFILQSTSTSELSTI